MVARLTASHVTDRGCKYALLSALDATFSPSVADGSSLLGGATVGSGEVPETSDDSAADTLLVPEPVGPTLVLPTTAKSTITLDSAENTPSSASEWDLPLAVKLAPPVPKGTVTDVVL